MSIPPVSVQAAERIYISYSILERSIPVASLDLYARTGIIDEDLEVYAQYASPQELAQLRTVLNSKAELSPIAVSQFLYTPQGEILLKRLGQVIQPESRLSGFNAIRAALILASADPDGLTLLNVLRQFPTRGLRIDVERSLGIVGSLEGLVSRTNRITAAIAQQSTQESVTEPLKLTGQPVELRQRGPYTWQKQTITLIDLARRAVSTLPSNGAIPVPLDQLRGRLFPVDIYLPIARSLPSKPVPVIVISHGLGSDRDTFIYLAQHLTSHGFAVLVPEHPGSNAEQLRALINGTASEVSEPTEFVDRPLDVTYLLDQLEQQTVGNAALRGRLDLQNVGVIGQSFGGYTALALAGAPISPQPPVTCRPDSLENTLNLSLLLQCLAFQPGQTGVDLRDDRVKAVIAVNPITSAVFGQSSIGQIKIPTMMITGNADTIAPAIIEQIQPFTWLTAEDKYLVMMDRGTHFSVTGQSERDDPLQIPPEVIGPNPAIARRALSALSVAFFRTYIANQPAFRSYLTAAYVREISQAPIPLSLVRSLNSDLLAKQ